MKAGGDSSYFVLGVCASFCCSGMNRTPLPVVVQPVENNDDVDGVGDKTIQGYQNYKE